MSGRQADPSMPWGPWFWSNSIDNVPREWRSRYKPSGEVEHQCREDLVEEGQYDEQEGDYTQPGHAAENDDTSNWEEGQMPRVEEEGYEEPAHEAEDEAAYTPSYNPSYTTPNYSSRYTDTSTPNYYRRAGTSTPSYSSRRAGTSTPNNSSRRASTSTPSYSSRHTSTSTSKQSERYTNSSTSSNYNPSEYEDLEADLQSSFAGMGFSESSSKRSQFNTRQETEDLTFEVINKPRRFFKLGRVFKVLWSEPAGETAAADVSNIEPSRFGGNIFTKMRTFIVVREMRECSICLPLFTYNGQGTLKSGVRPENHAAVYSSDSKAPSFPSENLTKSPYPIIVENPSEFIDPMSRLNFGKVYTVEHNVKVLKVGRIPDEYHVRLQDDYVLAIAGSGWKRKYR